LTSFWFAIPSLFCEQLKDDSSATSVGNNQTLAGAGAEAGLVASLSTLSLLRLLRLTRIVVSVRLFGIFEPLNVLLKGLYNSVKSVIWVRSFFASILCYASCASYLH